MAWSYRKRIKIAPGLSINPSKSGNSTSVRPKGTYLSAGIPGTVICSRQKISSATSSYCMHPLFEAFPITDEWEKRLAKLES